MWHCLAALTVVVLPESGWAAKQWHASRFPPCLLRPGDGLCGSCRAAGGWSRGCISAWCSGCGGPAIPARCGCRRRGPAGAWRSCAAACAGWCAGRGRPGPGTSPAAGRRCAMVRRLPFLLRNTAGLLPRSGLASDRRWPRASAAWRVQRLRAQQGQPLALALAADRGQAAVQVDIVEVQPGQLADAQRRPSRAFPGSPGRAGPAACRPAGSPASAIVLASGSAAASCPAAARAGRRPGCGSACPAGTGSDTTSAPPPAGGRWCVLA